MKWTEKELKETGRKSGKPLMIHGPIILRAYTYRLYLRKISGGRGLISQEEIVFIEFESLMRYQAQSKETPIVAIRNESTLVSNVKGKRKEWKKYKKKMKNHAKRDSTINSM